MKKPIIIIAHTGYWLIYAMLIILILLCLQVGTNLNKYAIFSNYKLWVFLGIFTLLPGIIGFYSYYAIIFPRYISKQKWLLSLAAAMLFSLAAALVGLLFIAAFYWISQQPRVIFHVFNDIAIPLLMMAIIATLNGLVGVVMKGFFSWYADIKIKQELTKKNLETELALVKSQLDPHFLFNTINNIDMLITKNPEQASAYLHKLSDMMRFMLYETHYQRMPLSKELEYIDKYISLQKIRYSNPNFVEFTSQTSTNHLLPPMLFIPFIENAFKFAKPMKDKPGIHIAIAEQAGDLWFTCTNTVDPEKVKSTSNGLGNKLMKRRLELLFPGKHLLTISHTPISFEVSLHIQLS